jgi:polysaccharide biosynthesis transport protein
MDTIDRSKSNLPAQFPAPLSPLPALIPALSTDLAATPTVQINPRIILRGLTRHWWLILLLCIVVSAPLMTLIYFSVQPTYEASSLLLIEPASPELFSPLKGGSGDGRSVTYLETQVSRISSARVLDQVVADPLVVNLPTIKKWEDPRNDLRKRLMVGIEGDTNLIRVSLELADPNEAKTIVAAVVEHYMAHNTDYSRGANKELMNNLSKQLEKLASEINTKRAQLQQLVTKGKVMFNPTDMLNTAKKDETDPTRPTFKSLSDDLLHKTMADMVQTDLELIEAQAMLDVKLDANKASREESEQQLQQVDEQQLVARIVEEFKKAPDVAALIEDIEDTREHLDHIKQNVRKARDPSRFAAQKQFDKLQKNYADLWEKNYSKIRQRLSMTAGVTQSPEGIQELKLKVAALKKKKEKQAELFKEMEPKQIETNYDTFEANLLDYQVKKMQSREDQIERNLEQLKFEANVDKYRVTLLDAASVPKTPSNNKRLKYMAAAPVGVLFMVLGLFLLLEVKAERVADPDALSTRVRSEVYALPLLPTARSIRKLSVSEADDQIEHFIQRLDHLRFAVCGNSSELGKGRCVLITSAIGGEGKTTLAVQLAARCGNAGMSTLLIDSDFRRSDLCALLEVLPQSPGLSDVLKDKATIDDVAIPVQDGIFYLLPVGTPVSDTSRLLQGPKFGQLISQLRERYDLIIIDSPPVLPVPDALILGRWADGALIAARYDISRFPQVERARRQLDNAGIAILGTVINGMRHSDSYYGRYTYNRQRSTQANSSDTI